VEIELYQKWKVVVFGVGEEDSNQDVYNKRLKASVMPLQTMMYDKRRKGASES